MLYPRSYKARGTLLALLLTGCGSESEAHREDAALVDGVSDVATPDGPCERTLFVGGTDYVSQQGWTVGTSAPSMITNGADYTELQTGTIGNQSGYLLLMDLDAFTGPPFKLEVVMLVQAVNAHNQFDAGAAILGSFTPPYGTAVDRQQMIYLDTGGIGWADNSQSYNATITDGAYHTYVLSVDASNTATVTMDGNPVLSRAGFTATGTIAIGDQTNDVNVDSTLRIRSVRALCP